MPKIGFASISMLQASWIDALKAASAYQFDAFELCCVYPDTDPEKMSPEILAQVNEIVKKSGIEIIIHAPFFELNIAAFCPGIREESIRLVQKAADLSEKLDAKVMVIHNGSFSLPGPPGANRKNDKRMKDQWNFNIAALKRINDYAALRGVTICLENIGFDPHTIDRDFEDMLEIRENVDKSLQFTFDMGHARLAEGAETGIRLLGENIRHIHVTDNFGERDDHLPLGDGNYDYAEFADFLRAFPYTITLEVVKEGDSPEPMLRARDTLMKTISLSPAKVNATMVSKNG